MRPHLNNNEHLSLAEAASLPELTKYRAPVASNDSRAVKGNYTQDVLA